MKDNKHKELDQFYTEESVSKKCCEILKEKLENYIDFNTKTFLEPSAGTGSFIKALKKCFNTENIKSYDIDPKHEDVKKADFLSTKNEELGENLITIGNPPFGKRSHLAMDFFNKAAEVSDIIAFIVPLQFEKYGVQSKLNKEFKLIHSEILAPSSFIYDGKPASIRCCFQIWSKNDYKYDNLRILTKPETSHPDFEMFLYNNTPEAYKYFDKKKYKWNFAVVRQGFYDYTEYIEDENKLLKNRQYMFFKTDNKEVLKNLKKINFTELSKNNTTTPGYGKADIIKYYKNHF